MSFDDLRRRAALVRDIPLETVLLCRGAERDRRDRKKWHTEQGSLSVSGAKFMSWRQGHGGGGAIDLLMHLAGLDFRAAVECLEQHLGIGPPGCAPGVVHRTAPFAPVHADVLRLPPPVNGLLGRVRQYLTRRRGLSPTLLEPLIESGRLYADGRGNAVFVLVSGKAQQPVGGELRGTGPEIWRGMAPGTRKDRGYFWVGERGLKSVVLCESAIDAISCHQLYRKHIGISTSGVRADPLWLHGLLAAGYQIYCGFDADEPGDGAAAQMMRLQRAVKRFRPSAHDWNDVLRFGR